MASSACRGRFEAGVGMKPWLGKTLGCVIAVLVVAPAVIEYRTLYDHHKRLREVTAGKLYRSGQLTAEGFDEAVKRLGIKTVVNVQDELPDPPVRKSFWNTASV